MSHKPVHLTAGLYSSLQCRHLIRASNVISSWSFLQMPYLILSQSGWWGYRAGDAWEDTGITFTPNPSSSPYFWPSLTPLVKISFSPQPSYVIKIKDSHHFSRRKYWALKLCLSSLKLCLLCRLAYISVKVSEKWTAWCHLNLRSFSSFFT